MDFLSRLPTSMVSTMLATSSQSEPTTAAQPSGWTRLELLAQHLLAAPTSAGRTWAAGGFLGLTAGPVKAGATSYTKADVLAKRKEGKCWIVLHGNVYDVTEFLDEHPGGSELITDIAPGDFATMSREFDDAEHSEEAMDQLQEFFKGKLVEQVDDEAQEGSEQEAAPAAPQEEEEEGEGEDEDSDALVANEGDPSLPFSVRSDLMLQLSETCQLSKDVTVFRFALAKPDHYFSLSIGKHILLSFEDGKGGVVSRAYTPVSPQRDQGFVDFLIKLYPGGKMSDYLSKMKIGQSIRMKGPKGKISYEGHGNFTLRRKGQDEQVQVPHIGMIAGGSGITPMFQIVQAIAADETDETRVTLLFANKTESDIILKHPLDEFVRRRPNQIFVQYVLDQPPANWQGEQGFIDADMIARTFGETAAEEGCLMMLCGPPPMIKKACVPALKSLGFANESVLKF